MDLEEFFKDRSDEEISAFAHNIGRSMDVIIKAKIGDVETTNKVLQARILEFREELVERDKSLLPLYDKHFGITKT